jgi:hypothetical protein
MKRLEMAAAVVSKGRRIPHGLHEGIMKACVCGGGGTAGQGEIAAGNMSQGWSAVYCETCGDAACDVLCGGYARVRRVR